MSNPQDVALFLAQFNSWRRGDETFAMPSPDEIGAQIDSAVGLLRRYAAVEAENSGLVAKMMQNHDVSEAIINAREATIARQCEWIVRLQTALKDAVSTYDPNRAETLVTAERQEAWLQALRF